MRDMLTNDVFESLVHLAAGSVEHWRLSITDVGGGVAHILGPRTYLAEQVQVFEEKLGNPTLDEDRETMRFMGYTDSCDRAPSIGEYRLSQIRCVWLTRVSYT